MKIKIGIILLFVAILCIGLTGCETSAGSNNSALDDTTITVDADNDGDIDLTININASARWGSARFGADKWNQ